MNGPLAGQRALVTAGASGIGRAIARRFAAAGARIFVCDIDPKALAAFLAEMPGAGGVLADVADPGEVDRLFDAAAAALGGLDILVNNAGIAGPTQKVEDIAIGDWDRCVAINLNGMFYCTRRGVPLLKAAGGGSIVNLSSVAGRLGYPLRTPYAASKWAVVGLTKSLAMELGPDGIRVNCIQPGLVAGPRIDRVIQAKADAFGIGYEEMKQRLLKTVSLRRMVTADDVAEMALFVCSTAGANITGQALSVCGDHQVLQ
ncbi:MAG: SDR family oxidoreductase [Rhodospirillales bacterium]|jgi:NAD(P)-dependent dehydrogenase (short-subunit alcohol dehydrogenase family)